MDNIIIASYLVEIAFPVVLTILLVKFYRGMKKEIQANTDELAQIRNQLSHINKADAASQRQDPPAS